MLYPAELRGHIMHSGSYPMPPRRSTPVLSGSRRYRALKSIGSAFARNTIVQRGIALEFFYITEV